MITRILLLVATLTLSLMAAPATATTVRHIEERFLAPCCWAESVAFHNSPAAIEMRAEIEKLVAGGKTEPEIVDYYVGR